MLPKFAARWVDKHIDIAWDQHTAHCMEYEVDPHDVDPPESWRENLHLWFPEAPNWQRSIDWYEIRATFTIPVHRGLRLCKVGWHMWGGVYWGQPQRYAMCTICGERRYGWLPRWAE